MGFKEILDTAVTRERFRIDDCISLRSISRKEQLLFTTQ